MQDVDPNSSNETKLDPWTFDPFADLSSDAPSDPLADPLAENKHESGPAGAGGPTNHGAFYDSLGRGEMRLYCEEHAGLFISNRRPNRLLELLVRSMTYRYTY